MAEKCAARVVPSGRYGAFQIHGCNRNAGHGKDSLYCKQHARQYPADNQETATMYAAKCEFSGFDVSVCQVFGVTDKSLVIASAQAIFGYTPSKGEIRIAPHGSWRFFLTLREALEWVRSKMLDKVDNLNSEIARIKRNLEPAEQLLALDDLENRVLDAVESRKNNFKRDLE